MITPWSGSVFLGLLPALSLGCGAQFDLCPDSLTDRPSICEKLPPPNRNNVWYSYNSSDTVIVFVHGIFGDSRGTWLYVDEKVPDKSAYWPELVNSDDRLEKPSIYLGGFYTAPDSGGFDANQASKELFTAISIFDGTKRRVLDKKNLLFITHSTGGIIVRHMLYHQKDSFNDKNVGLVLMASPSYGSDLADTLGLLADLYNNKLAKQLQWGGPDILELDRNFKDFVSGKKINLVGCEGLENHFVVHRKWLPIFTKRVVVNELSGARYFASGTMLGGTDHFSVVKPKTADDRPQTFLLLFYQQQFKPLIVKSVERSTDSLTAAERQVKALKSDILVVRGDFETQTVYQQSRDIVRHKASSLGEQLVNINDDSLGLGYRLIKYEYSAYAYVMAASVETEKSFRIAYAKKAIGFGQEALGIVKMIKKSSSQADGEALALWNWIVESDDDNRCHYTNAIALAIILRSGGTATLEDIRSEIAYIAPQFLEAFPLETNDDLKAVLGKNAKHSGGKHDDLRIQG
jgi:hypothetical protein